MALLMDRIAADRHFLWLDSSAYAGALLAGGAPPWLQVGDFIAWQRKAQGLLRSDVIVLPVGPLASVWLVAEPERVAEMAARRRASFSLKILLADDALRALLTELAGGLRSSFRNLPLALALPSPRRWTSLAYASAFPGETAAVDADALDSASTYVADFLRSFAGCEIDALLLEENEDHAPASAADLELYRPVLNVASHYRWDLGVRLSGQSMPSGPAADVNFWIAPRAISGVPVGIVVPAGFWSGEAPPEPPAGGFRFAEIPADAEPESVLERLAVLRRTFA